MRTLFVTASLLISAAAFAGTTKYPPMRWIPTKDECRGRGARYLCVVKDHSGDLFGYCDKFAKDAAEAARSVCYDEIRDIPDCQHTACQPLW